MKEHHTFIEKLQIEINKDCQKFLESSKLKLWSCKADLLHLSQQKSKIEDTIRTVEEKYSNLEKQCIEYENELEYLTETITIGSNYQIFSSTKPWKIVLDISMVILKILGLPETSWEAFLKLSKNLNHLKGYLKNFNASEADQETFELISAVVKKHGMHIKLKDSKVPDDFNSLSNWFQTVYFILYYKRSLEEVLVELETLNKKFTQIYIKYKDLEKLIKVISGEIEQTILIQNRCEKVKKKLKKRGLFEIELLSSELNICEKMLNSLKNDDKVVVEETPISNNPDSIFVSHCYSPDPKILECKEYYEDSFLELPTQKGNTFENTITELNEYKKSKSKKRCCGWLS